MLSKSSRLNLKTSFKWVAASSIRIGSSSFTILVRLGENTNPLIGVATSKKHFNSSVERNLAKRKIFNAVIPLLPSLRTNVNLVIMPKSGVLKRTVDQLTEEIRDVIHSNYFN